MLRDRRDRTESVAGVEERKRGRELLRGSILRRAGKRSMDMVATAVAVVKGINSFSAAPANAPLDA